MSEPSVPGTSALDIYRSARLLIGYHGTHEAHRIAVTRAVELKGDALGQAVWARIIDAIAQLSRTERKPDEAIQ